MATAQSITHVYHYDRPLIVEHDGYQQMGLNGCLPNGNVGEPSLPWQSVSLLLPQGQEALSYHVELSDWVEMDGTYRLFPVQRPRPYSCDEAIPFAKNETLYRSTDAYPAECFGSITTQYLNGVAFAFGGFTPMRYVPATGKVSYARTATVSIETTASRDDHSGKLWLSPENEATILQLAQNGELLDSYRQRGRDVNDYDMLVITSEAWVPMFGEYLDLYNGKGVRTHIVALEEIYATMTGRDEQEQIRNYIIQEYENHGISMVSLGGDVAIVPYRSLWCFAQEGYEDYLPADMYYACLDGTLNDDNDDKWGEVGEDDLLPELGIGRLPFNNENQFNIIMEKTFSYLLNPVLGEFTSPILGAEHLGDGYYGSDDMERLIGTNSDFGYTTHGYPTDYNFKKYYETPSQGWNGGAFRNVIRTGGQYVNHVGHANTGIVAGWDISAMNNEFFSGNDGVNHNYMLFHSHGCICGDFSHGCILERMVTIPTGFVATTGNSRYGWYQPWGDGMAAHIHREMMDAYCHDHIPSIGMALRQAKIATAPWVNTGWGDEGCLRWNIYCLNIMGDGALTPWFEEPFNPNVVYEQGLMTGTTSTTVTVTHFDAPLDNFRVCLFDGETLLATAITDNNGVAVLNFSPALDVTGELQLIVTGQSAWPQVLEVNGFESGTPYIYGDLLGFEGEPLFGLQSLWVGGDLYNKGDMAASNVHASISTDCEYILPNSNDLVISEMAPNSALHYDHLGSLDIADNIPDLTLFTLNLATTVGETTHTTRREFLALAPKLEFVDYVVDDNGGNGNGYIDPGETVTLHVNILNAGHATAPDAYLTVSCDDERIHFQETTLPLGNIGTQDSFTADLVMDSDDDIIEGTVFYLDLELHTGAYTTTDQYAFANGQIAESFETGDFSLLDWFLTGDQDWFVTDEVAHTGSFSARSGDIGHNEVSNLVVYGDYLEDAEISFWFKVSSEYRKDYLVFYVDNKVKKFWSGEVDWTYFSYSFPAGHHVFRWTYDTNGSGTAGANCAWIDDINFPRSCIISDVETTLVTKATLLYPNPCHGTFALELTEESQVDVYNLLGQQVISLGKATGRQELHLDESGIYIVRIQNGSGVENHRLIVE